MKKSVILVMLVLTLVFASFVAGFYVGRNFNHGSVQISGIPTEPTTTQAPSGSSGSSTTAPVDSTPPATTAPQWPIDINTATLEQLDLLPGIGPVLAQAIIDYRAQFGPFTAAEDLLNVNGIGEKKLAAILEFITVGG